MAPFFTTHAIPAVPKYMNTTAYHWIQRGIAAFVHVWQSRQP
jgi:hypothetical protein